MHTTGSGPAVVLLHSSLSSAKQWLPLVLKLKSKFTCINIDLLGYGEADAVADEQNYNFDQEALRILSAINHHIGEQPFHLVGHSCGGAVALKMAVEHSDRLLSVSLFEPVAFHLFEQGSDEQIAAAKFAHSVKGIDNYLAAEIFTDFWNKKGFFRALPTKMQAMMAKDMPKVHLDFIGLVSERYQLADIGKIMAPMLMMVGKQSPYLSQLLAQKIIACSSNVIAQTFDAGHMAPISHAALVLPTIEQFITSVA